MNAIEKVTPNPSRYMEEPEERELEDLLEEEQWERASAGKFWMRAELCREEKIRKSLSATERRDAVRVVSDVLGKRAEYQRKEGDYKIGEWIVTNYSVTSDFFGIGERAKNMKVFAALDAAGYRARNGVRICYRPKAVRMEETLALMAMAERELKQLEKRMFLPEEPVISMEREGFQLYVPGKRMGYGKLEESLLTYFRMIKMAGLRRGKVAAG